MNGPTQKLYFFFFFCKTDKKFGDFGRILGRHDLVQTSIEMLLIIAALLYWILMKTQSFCDRKSERWITFLFTL